MQTVGYSEWKLCEADDRQQGVQGPGESQEGRKRKREGEIEGVKKDGGSKEGKDEGRKYE